MWSLTDQLRALDSGETKKPVHWLTELSEKYGISYFALFQDINVKSTLEEAVVLSNWPPGLLKHLRPIDKQVVSALASAVAANLTPFFWSAQEHLQQVKDETTQSAIELINSSKLLTGLIVPVVSPSGALHAAVFGDLNRLVSQQTITDFQYSISKIFEQIWSDKRSFEDKFPDASKHNVSTRERDCLYWLSQGKTSAEIGKILDLSEHTASRYIDNAIVKLGVTNRTHAVAFALREKIIL